MKILQINNFHYLRGGADKIYLETGKLLKSRGHEVIFFSSKSERNVQTSLKTFFIENVEYRNNNVIDKARLIGRYVFSSESRKVLENILKKERPDIAHLHIFHGRITSSILPILRKNKIPTVMSVHDYRLLCPVSTFIDSEAQICEKCACGKYYHNLLKKCNKGSRIYSLLSSSECYIRDLFFSYEKYINKFIFVSDFVMKKYLYYRPAIKEKSIRLYNFLDINEYEPNIKYDNYYLYIGRLSIGKGIITLLRTWRHFPHLFLKIAGEGDLKESILDEIKKNRMCNVELLGYLKGQQLINVIRNAKFIIVPSEWYETFGLTIIESFACGKPVLGSRIGAIPELIMEGENGFLFDCRNVNSLANAISLAEKVSASSYSRMSRFAREYVEKNFSKEHYYDKLISLYNDMLCEDGGNKNDFGRYQ